MPAAIHTSTSSTSVRAVYVEKNKCWQMLGAEYFPANNEGHHWSQTARRSFCFVCVGRLVRVSHFPPSFFRLLHSSPEITWSFLLYCSPSVTFSSGTCFLVWTRAFPDNFVSETSRSERFYRSSSVISTEGVWNSWGILSAHCQKYHQNDLDMLICSELS